MSYLRATIIIRPQKAETLCRLLIERDLLETMTVAENIGLSAGGQLPRAQITGLLPSDKMNELAELVATHGRSSLAGDGKILFQRIENELDI